MTSRTSTREFSDFLVQFVDDEAYLVVPKSRILTGVDVAGIGGPTAIICASGFRTALKRRFLGCGSGAWSGVVSGDFSGDVSDV
jgi:hypothetical protein